MDTNNQTTNTNPVPPVAGPTDIQAPAAPNPESGTIESTPVVKSPPPPKSSGGSKKKLMLALVVVIILVVIAGIVGFYFMQMNNKPGEVTVVPSVAPTQTPTPTVDPDAITNNEQLDKVIGEIEDATVEANLTTEVDNLKKDSNF